MPLFQEVTEWKLRKQRGRSEHHRQVLTANLVESITACAFGLRHADDQVLAGIQCNMLASMPGVGAGLATAILALTFPDQHGVIDFRVWRVVFGEERQFFSTNDYLRYRRELLPFARSAGWSAQKADFMIWMVGVRMLQNINTS